jgi:ribosomal protein S18 acetylase RimI-like enzyme
MIRQARAQYDALIADGYEFTFFDSQTDPYAGNPFNAMRDLRKNKRMAVYGTYDGYGTDGITGAAIADNPMLADTGLEWVDQNGVSRPVTANDIFRAVHDAFGHGLEGAGFRARGEENAWQAHARLFTGPGLGALTSETRGQNSWLNYGPYAETNRTARVEDTVFAEQKTGLMPEWTWTEGRAGDASDIRFSRRQPVRVEMTRKNTATAFAGKKVVGQATAWEDSRGEFVILNTEVRDGYRRQGIARQMYSLIEETAGKQLTPAISLSDDAFEFWKSFRPSAVAKDLRHWKDQLIGARVVKNGEPGEIISASGGVAVMRYDEAQDGGTQTYLRRDDLNPALEAAGSPTIDFGGDAPAGAPDILFSRRQTDTPEFKRWFGDSKVVDADGQPLIVYRGQHGETDAQIQSRLGSISFGSEPAAQLYSRSPNDSRDTAVAPRVIPA